jgi:predicted ATPase
VPSLSLPDLHHPPPIEELVRFEAIQLFVDRATSMLPAFELTPQNAPALVEVCHRLDGIPLALELAAARIKALTVEQIAGRLDDCFRLLTGGSRSGMTRQQTLKATLDWSFDLLTPREQTLFNRLSVFAGSFDLEGAEVICSDLDEPAEDEMTRRGIEVAEADVLDLLAQLVNKSLVMAHVRGDRMRYHLLEPIRQYARDRLGEVGETANIRNRHLHLYTALAEQAAPELWGAGQIACLSQLDMEHDNLQAALGWSVEQGSEEGLRLGTALWQFWVLRGNLAQGRQWLERLLARHLQPTERRARALMGASALSVRLFDNSMMLSFALERFSVYEAMSDLEGMADACYLIGSLMWIQGDNGSSRLRLLQSRELARQVGSRRADACATHALGVMAAFQGDYAEAESLMRESVSVLSEIEDDLCVSQVFVNFGWMPTPFVEYGAGHTMHVGTFLMFRDVRAIAARAYALANLGNLACMRHDTTRASAHLRESSSIFQELNDNYGLAQVLRQSGNLATSEGDYDQARELLYRSLDICTRLKDGRGIGLSLHNIACLDLALGNHEAAKERLEVSLDLLGDMSDRPGGAMVLKLLGYLAMATGDYERARSFAEETAMLYRKTGGSLANNQWVAYALLDGAIFARLQGDYTGALAYLQESIGDFRGEGILPGIAATLYQFGCVEAGMGDLEASLAYNAASLASFRELEDRLGMAFVCEALSILLVGENPARAVRIAGAASALRESVPPTLSRASRPDLDSALNTARQVLSEEEFTALWRAGRAYTPEEVTAEIEEVSETDHMEDPDKLSNK